MNIKLLKDHCMRADLIDSSVVLKLINALEIAIDALRTPASDLACTCCDSADTVHDHFKAALGKMGEIK